MTGWPEFDTHRTINSCQKARPRINVSTLTLYPVKSCSAIASQSAQLDERGIAYDRHWMVVGSSDLIFLTQRSFPRMAMIKTTLGADSLVLGAPGMEEIGVPIENSDGPVVNARVWLDLCESIDDGDSVADWLSTFLKIKCRLVHMRDGFRRPVDSSAASMLATTGSGITAFADAYPALVISQASLDDLNTRLPAPIPMNRFRPNIVVEGCEPYAEDSWRRVRMGEVEFDIIKPCIRCVITAIDQETGEKTGPEPLQTLANYRRWAGGVYFGQNAVNRSKGRIAVGDTVELIS